MNNKWPHLKNAPITEAIIEFQYDDSVEVTIDALTAVEELIREQYPNITQKRSNTIKTEMTESGPQTEFIDHGKVGIVAKSDTGNKVLTLMLDRFAFSHMHPYSTWEDLEQDTFKSWNLAQQNISISSVKRIGVRFINKLEIDLPLDDLSDYLYSAPNLHPDLPQTLSGFHQQFVVPDPETGAMAIITQHFDGFDREKNVALIILDIDVSMTGQFIPDEKNLKKILVLLREYKNKIFHMSITEQVRRKYQ